MTLMLQLYRPALLLSLLSMGCARARSAGEAAITPAATATLAGADGKSVGSATLYEVAGAVRIDLSLSGLPDGTHGVHLHQTGTCDAPEFTTAGGHINPTDAKHGTKNPNGPHAGDMPNVIISGGRSVLYSTMTMRVALAGGLNGLFDADGSAIVVHATADDEMTDPSGNSGARIACGVITKR
ncbi:MAG: superoxide dismutase family protein [Gemmatimonadaceae bacterium]